MYEVLNKSTYWLINSRKANNSRTHQLINLLTQKLKSLSFILQYHANLLSVLEKIQVKKQVKNHFFYPFTSWNLSFFKPMTCILHHFTFLVWLQARNFSSPKNHFLPPKPHFFNAHFALSSPILHGSERFCLYNCSVFLCFSPCVQHHFTPQLARFYLAFSIKTHCVQHQNTVYFAPKRTPFSSILHHIQLKMARKLVQMTVCCNKYSFFHIRELPPFCNETNPRENRFFAARQAIGGQKGHSSC